ncbi:MAG: pyridoxine 5'-phosphate synthase [Candidatus Omnitrophica bacterium]|nr:pyridoxine 5'-phosphate synthase [Candidatus Omnitrophota bacterium]
MIKLGVNIDHVATLRQARKAAEPEPVAAAIICELAGCDSITVHLREDRRHINERDVELLKKVLKVKLNLEMSISPEIAAVACSIKPEQSTIVPERRQEITTEGGLDVIKDEANISKVVKRLADSGVKVSLFIDPVKEQIETSKKIGAEFIELHTGSFANSKTESEIEAELERLKVSAQFASKIGLRVNAGHGITYLNVQRIVEIPEIEELNIGHSIISRAVLVGLDRAVREMLDLMRAGQNR